MAGSPLFPGTASMARFPSPSARVLITAGALAVGVLMAEWVVAPWALRRERTVAGELARIAHRELEELGSERSDRRLWTYDSELGWTLRPGAESESASTNQLGARGPREYDSRPSPGKLRLVCFGESFVFGHEVADADTWEAQLEAFDERLEVLNFGVSGYGTDQALLRFRRIAIGLDADVAVLGLNVTSIGRNVNRLRMLLRPNHVRPSVKPRFRLGLTEELQLVPLPFATEREVLQAAVDGVLIQSLADHEAWRDGFLSTAGSNLERAVIADERTGRRAMFSLWMDAGGEAYRLTMELVQAFDADARAAGIRRVIVLFFPVERDLHLAARARGLPWDGFRHTLQERGIEVLDLEQALAAAAEREPIYATTHLNAAGNSAVAAHVLEWIEHAIDGWAPPAGRDRWPR